MFGLRQVSLKPISRFKRNKESYVFKIVFLGMAHRYLKPQPPLYSIYKKLFFYRCNDRGAHLLTVDIWEQPLSVGPYIFLCEANEE